MRCSSNDNTADPVDEPERDAEKHRYRKGRPEG